MIKPFIPFHSFLPRSNPYVPKDFSCMKQKNNYHYSKKVNFDKKFINKDFNNYNFYDTKNSYNSNDSNDFDKQEELFDFFGIKLHSDDLLIIFLLFFLYQEDVKDTYLYVALILLLLS